MSQAAIQSRAIDDGSVPASIDDVVYGFRDLPTLAPLAMEVIRLADDDDASMKDMADVISSDPGLAARLLRLANSAAYSRGREVTNLPMAATLLGMRTLKMVTLGFSLVANVTTDRFDCSILWRRSLATAVLAQRLTSEVDPGRADDAFAAGLLANIGKLALAEEPMYVEAVATAGPWMTPQQERELLGFTSDEVTARILAGWELPTLFVDAVRSRDDRSDGRAPSPLGGVLEVADAAAALILGDDADDKAGALDRLTIATATHLGMTVGDIERVIDQVGPELDEMARMFDLDVISPSSVEEIVSAAQARLVRFSIEATSQLSQEQQRNQELTAHNLRLLVLASTDTLTGLPNRRTFDAYLAGQVAGRMRHPRHTQLGLVLFDVDRFKDVNDRFGHGVGDEVLREIGRRLRTCTRQSELVARIGGEEFALVLPDVTVEELQGAAERMRSLIGDEPIETRAGSLQVTVSVGASCIHTPGDDAAVTLSKAADDAIYRSKAGGRNRVSTVPLD